MRLLSHADAFEVLCLQAADEGRGDVLYGSCLQQARKEGRAFMVGEEFPDVYLEFPLIGEPFLDITVLYGQLEEGTRVDSPAAAGTGATLDWFADVHRQHSNVSFGFERDVREPQLPAAAIHFQPRAHTDLVRPFCEVAGEPQAADLYLGLAERMPKGWPLSFFGMFRGRVGAPLRVCGYLAHEEKLRCAESTQHTAETFDAVGFSAYDEAMLAQVSELMAMAPGSVDFQFDIWPDETIGDIFAIDVQYEIAQPSAVQASFAEGPVSRVMNLVEQWGAADGRWMLAGDAAFARALPVELDDGTIGKYGLTLMPQWMKVRWARGKLQPSKLYYLAHAGLTKK